MTKLRVLIATPLGEGGNGGIDRLMDAVRRTLRAAPVADVEVRFAETRGQGSIAMAPAKLASFLLKLSGKPDVVHINLSSYGSTYRKLIVAAACRALRIPYVLHLHGSLYMKFWTKAAPWLDTRIKAMFTGAARVVVLGEVWRRFVAERAPGARIEIVPNAAAAPTLPHVPSDTVRVAFMGRVGNRKGTFDLIEALSALKDREGWRAVLAGDGEIEKARQLVAERGLADKVTVPGWMGPEEAAKLVSESDIMVLPSYDENLPMSVIEGMGAGLAVITTPVGAVEDIISDGETGLLVQPGDIPALSHALERLIGDADLRANLSAAALKVHRERLDLPPYVARLIAIWKECAR